MFGGKLMDSFVDKLAHRLTAQEMIRANSAAEAEEMNKLKSQVERYHECLKQMELLTKEMASIEQRVNGALENDIAKVTELTETGVARMQELVEESLAKLESYQQETLSPEMIKEVVDMRLDKTDENLHKECVKVYRNIQAVVAEENGKTAETLQENVHSLNGRLNGVLSVAIMALLMSSAGVILQVLSWLGIF